MGETLFSKRYDFTYKYKKLIGEKKQNNTYITAYPQNNPFALKVYHIDRLDTFALLIISPKQ